MRSLILKYRKEVKNEEFIKENQIINISKKFSVHNLSNEYYQELSSFLTKKPGEKYPKL